MLSGIWKIPADLMRRLQPSDPVEAVRERIDQALDEPTFQRDPEFLDKLVSLMEIFNRYFDSEVRGFENVPDRPALLVGNHSGALLTPDTSALFAAWHRERGHEFPLVGLAFDGMFVVPGVRTLMRKMGEIPASHENAARALAEGASVIVYPGGDREIFRPWTERNRIDFGGRAGFVRLALRAGVPVIPVVGHGGHNSTIVVARGDALARRLHLERVRLGVFPVLWQIPWGFTMAGVPGLPLPAKVTLQICPAPDWSHLTPEAADDPEIVQRCYDEVTDLMQAQLTALAEERPFPVLSRLRSLLPGA